MRRVGVIGYEDPRHLIIHASSGRCVSDAWQGSGAVSDGDVTCHGVYHYHDQADGNYHLSPRPRGMEWYRPLEFNCFGFF
jgi:hypothetical protein